ncbi:hypothetical protein [Rhizobium leguminosarum]|uniref:hypothetical protein n=1 Tax=Rhizobium leguminosarum TaxID=384 RepID=UPI003F97D11D
MIDDVRKAWLRGAYLDRIIEAAQRYAAGHTHFADSEWESYIGDEFAYLSELTSEDHGYLREQAGLEGFRRIVTTLSETREKAFGKLRDDNGDVIQPDARFAMDIGWLSLLQHAADRVRTYPSDWRVRIDGAKEKLGCCVVHVTCDYSARGCRSEVERLREEVRLRSLSMCEICGSPGRLRLSGYAKTVCDQHEPVMGEFREDDGKLSDPWTWKDDADHIRDLIGKGRAPIAEYPAASAELLRDLDPVRPRPTQHVMDERIDPIRATNVGRRVDDDTWQRVDREQELLIEFGWRIVDTVQGACVKVEYLDGYVHNEVAGWHEFAIQPLTELDVEFLHGYLRGLIDEEYERIRKKQDAERNDEQGRE